MQQSGSVNCYERLPMRCSGVFQMDNEVVTLRRAHGQRVAYASSMEVQAGLITRVPFVIVDASASEELKIGRWYKVDGDIAMQKFVLSQRVFLRRESLVEIGDNRSVIKPLVNKLAITGRGKVVSNRLASAKSGQENYYVATVTHRQWDMTRIMWVEFTAQYIYDMESLGKTRAGLIREGNILDLEGHCVSWSDWDGGWIVMLDDVLFVRCGHDPRAGLEVDQ